MENTSKWNQPHKAAKRTESGVSVWRGAIAALVVVVGAAIAFWLVGGHDSEDVKPKEKPQAKTSLDTPKPVVIHQTSEGNTGANVQEKPLTWRERQLNEIRAKFGNDIPESLKATVYFLEHPPKREFKVKSMHDYLRHPAERQIAGVALMEPGTFFVVKPEFGDAFDSDFMSALTDKAEIYKDDTYEVRTVKGNIEVLKKEIASICTSEGKRPSEVMNELAETMYELGKYQRDLEQEIDNLRASEDCSDQDYEVFCEAANKMLESKGLAPIQFPGIARRSFHIRAMQRMAERKAAREAAKEAKE